MSVMLSECLPLLVTAPQGVHKLRGLILELAMRGKLLPQESDDEPASEILSRIKHERAQLETAGRCKKTKPVPALSEDERPYGLPAAWAWVRLGEITNFGQTDKGGEVTECTWVLDLEDIQKDTSVLLRKVSYAERQAKSDKNRFKSGDVLYGKLRPYLNKVIVADEDGVCTTEILPLRGFYGVVPRFLMYALKQPAFLAYVNAKSYGMKMPRLGTEDGRLAALPLAPEAEQHRIVAKIDELMALCDRLEAEQVDAESAQAKLVEALLGTLTESTDAADFAANWQRLAEHFDTLFSTESSVNTLKQTILQLGVSGRLTNSNAFESLKLGDVLIDAGYGTSQKCDSTRVNGACPVLRIPNVVRETIDLADLKFSVLEEKELHKLQLLEGDILVVRTNGSAELVGRCAVVKGVPKNAAFASYIIRLRFDPSRVNPEFAQRCLQNHRLQNRMIDFARTTAGQYNVSIGRLRELEIQIPSPAEQHSIVAKIDELLSLCGDIEAVITESRGCQERLASALIESALRAA